MEKPFKKLIAGLVIFCLLIAQYSIFAINIAEAVEETLQTTTITKGSKIEFNAYFRGSTNVSTRTAVLNTQEVQRLYLEINVKDQVSLVDGKIKLENPNFTIKEDELKESDYVKNVNIETNEIELKKIYSNTTAIIELPVLFKAQDKVNTNYFDQEIEVTLNGKYENSKQKQKDLEGKTSIKPTWRANTELNLSQEVEKFFNLGENGTLLQQKVTTEVVNNLLPRDEEKIEVEVPTLSGERPTEVIVLVDGERKDNRDASYDNNSGIVTISNKNIEDGEGNISWESGKIEYTLVYRYAKNVELAQTPVTLNAKSSTLLYTKENAEEKEDLKQVMVTPVGNMATVKTSLYGDIYKGYMYHNEAKGTEYKEANDIEISYLEGLEGLELQTSSNFNVTYKQTQFKKSELFSILGRDGKVTIKGTTGEVISEITNDTETDDQGIITVNYPEGETTVVIDTTAPQVEGVFRVLNTKVLSGATNVPLNVLKATNNLVVNSQVTTNLSRELSQASLELKEPITEAKLSLSKTELSTLNTTNVEMVATLVSNNEAHELFKNPRLQIRLPENVESVKVNSINKLYADELQFGTTRLINNVIDIQLIGEQTAHLSEVCEGIQVVVNADITFNKTMPSSSTKVDLVYTNENNGNTEQVASQDVRISSKYGAFLYSKLDSINAENETLETFSQETVEGEIDTKAPAKQTNAFTEVVNNYEEPMTNVEVVISLPNREVTEEEKNTIDLRLLNSVITQKENTKIFYATEDIDVDSNRWQEQVANLQEVKKVKLVTDELKPGEPMPIAYSMAIPENLQGSETANQVTKLNYSYQGQNFETMSTLKLTANEDLTAETINGKVLGQNIEGLEVQAQASSVGKEIQNGGSVEEGQTIRYNVAVTNKTGRDLTNLTLEATQTDAEGNSNVTFYGITKEEEKDIETDETIIHTYYEEDENLKSAKTQKDTLKNGETYTFQYEFSINESLKENEITKGILAVNAEGLETQQIMLGENKIEQADLKLITYLSAPEELEVNSECSIPFGFTIKNISSETLKDVLVDIPLPQGTKLEEEYKKSTDKYEYIEEENNIIKLKIKEIEANSFVPINMYIYVESIPENLAEMTYKFYCGAFANGKKYFSNQVEKSAKQNKVEIEIKQTSDFNNEYAERGNVITYITNIVNKGLTEQEFIIEDNLPKILNLQEGYIAKDGQKINDLEQSSMANSYYTIYKLQPQENIQAIIKAEVGKNVDAVDEFSHYINVHNSYQSDGEESAITYKVKTEVYNSAQQYGSASETPNSGNGSTGGQSAGQTGGYTGTTAYGTGSISGQTWLDTNKDGIKNESGFSGIQVMLINASTGSVVNQSSTSGNGSYSFQNIADGSYIVGFKYDTTKYSATEYRAAGSSETDNSDVVTREITVNGQNQRLAVTDEIQISGNAVSNIDAGFSENTIFDLSLQKNVRRILVQTSKQTKEYDEKDTKLAKIELHRKDIQGATVLIEYVIKVTNEGETPGFAGDIIDYQPKELTFSSEINRDWYSAEGKLHNQTLANTLINPGETKEVSLTLTKTMTEDNAGAVQNIAEISKAANDLGQSDKDSTPGNNKDGEDDKSSADVIISIGTGALGYTAIVIATLFGLAFVGVAIYNIMETARKEADEDDEEEEGV